MAGPEPETLSAVDLRRLQADRLQALLAAILPANRFYARRFAQAGLEASDVRLPEDLRRLPFTTKDDLQADQADHPPYGEIHTYPVTRYIRLHQTSGTSGRPLRWLDTPASWARLLDCWSQIYRVAGVVPSDRLFFPFSFGPFIGFWTAFEAATRNGNLCLTGGGMSSTARLQCLRDNSATVVLTTPTYALHLAEIAHQEGVDLSASSVRALIVAGEPGGNIPATRQRIEAAWGARVFDHSGMTEVGPLGIECRENPGGLHLLESECIAEVIDSISGRATPAGEPGELVLTTLHRWGSPLLRYRTGDLVRVDPAACSCGRQLIRLQGGILGRVDDMIHVRGNNVHPSALEAVLRRLPEVAEYRVEVRHTGALTALSIAVEAAPPATDSLVAERVDQAIRDAFLFRAEVKAVPPGSLPRFEMKARRLVVVKDDAAGR